MDAKGSNMTTSLSSAPGKTVKYENVSLKAYDGVADARAKL